VVVVVDGVMTIQGDVNAVHKAKDHSRVPSNEITLQLRWRFSKAKMRLAREGEPDALKDASPVRERLHRDRLFVRAGMAR
jgi:hypothetical protein